MEARLIDTEQAAESEVKILGIFLYLVGTDREFSESGYNFRLNKVKKF